MGKMDSEVRYGFSGDLGVLKRLKRDASTGFNSDEMLTRAQLHTGGGQLNIMSAGALEPFVRRGLFRGFKDIYAGSSGAANALMAKAVAFGEVTPDFSTSLIGTYHQDNVLNKLVSWNWGRPHFDIDTLEKTLRAKGVDFKAVKDHFPHIFVSATYPNGENKLIRIDNHDDPIETVADLMSPVLMSQRARRRPFHDGSFLHPLPITKAIEGGAKEIVAFLAEPPDLPLSRVVGNQLMHIVGFYLLRGRLADYQQTSGKLRSLLLYPSRYLKELQILKDPSLRPSVDILAFHPLNLGRISPVCMDSPTLRQAGEVAMSTVDKLILAT